MSTSYLPSKPIGDVPAAAVKWKPVKKTSTKAVVLPKTERVLTTKPVVQCRLVNHRTKDMGSQEVKIISY